MIKISTIGWVLIPVWIIFVLVVGQVGPVSQVLQSLSTENAGLTISFILLVPIAFLTFPLAYKMDLSRFTTSGRTLKSRKWMRIFFSVSATAIILVLSWYLAYVVSYVLHF